MIRRITLEELEKALDSYAGIAQQRLNGRRFIEFEGERLRRKFGGHNVTNSRLTYVDNFSRYTVDIRLSFDSSAWTGR